MRVASVDIGSNTTMLLIVEKGQEGFEVLCEKLYFTRLAEQLTHSRQISASALYRLEKAFLDIKKNLEKYEVKKVKIVATSAARQATNKEEIFTLAKTYSLPSIEIISSEKEASLTFLGAFFGLGSHPEKALVIDIGGGSTEVVSSHQTWCLNMGSVSLTEKFLFLHPCLTGELEKMNHYIDKELEGMKDFKGEDFENLIFVAGTPTTLAFLEKKTSDMNAIHGTKLEICHVENWIKELSLKSIEERKKIPGLPEHRADVIVAGLSLLLKILKKAGHEQFLVSGAGVRYGLILEQL